MANQYEVLGKAPTPDDLKKLSPDEVHLTIKNLNAGYGKMEILHNFDLFVNKAQSLCLIGQLNIKTELYLRINQSYVKFPFFHNLRLNF